MRIAFFCEFYPTPRTPFGGAFYHNFAKGLVRRGHEVWVFRFKDLSLGEARHLGVLSVNDFNVVDGVRIITRMIPKIPKLPRINQLRLRRIAFQQFRKVHRQTPFDSVHLHFSEMYNSLLGLMIARKFELPTVCTEQSTGFITEGQIEETFAKASIVLRGVDVLSVVSERLAKTLEARLNRPVYLIDNGVDELMYHPLEGKIKSRRLVSVGFLLKRKNFDGLIRAFSTVLGEYPDLLLDIIGGGPEEGSLKSLIHELGLDSRVRLLGLKSNEEVAGLLRQYDYFVLPSHAETFGVVVIEALFSGLPVLVTRCGGPERIVREGIDGIVCDPNVESLAQGLRSLLSRDWTIDDEYLKAHYSLNAAAQQLESLYQKAAGQT